MNQEVLGFKEAHQLDEELPSAQRFSFSCSCDLHLSPPNTTTYASPRAPFLHDHHRDHQRFQIHCHEDDEGDDDDDDGHDNTEEDDEDYIEIAIEHRQAQSPVPDPDPHSRKRNTCEDGGGDDDDDDLEFRISFSSAYLFQEFQTGCGSPNVLASHEKQLLHSPSSHKITSTTTIKAILHPDDDAVTEAQHSSPKTSTSSSSSASSSPSSSSTITLAGSITCPTDSHIHDLSPPKIKTTDCSRSDSSSSSGREEANHVTSKDRKSNSSSGIGRSRMVQFHDSVADDSMVMHTSQPTYMLSSLSCLRPYYHGTDEEEAEIPANQTEECFHGRGSPQAAAPPGIRSWKLLQSRKVTKVKTAINGGIMKLFIKFRSIKIRSVISSYMMNKPEPEDFGGHDPECSSLRSNTSRSILFDRRYDDDKQMMKSFNRCSSVQIPENNVFIRGSSFGFGFGCGSSSIHDQHNHQQQKVDAKAISAAVVGNSSGRRKEKVIISQSCPSSIKCSPIHGQSVSNIEAADGNVFKMYTIQENSIEGAIAYCKRSFCQMMHQPFDHDEEGFQFHQ